jgi:hypothetical protein
VLNTKSEVLYGRLQQRFSIPQLKPCLALSRHVHDQSTLKPRLCTATVLQHNLCTYERASACWDGLSLSPSGGFIGKGIQNLKRLSVRSNLGYRQYATLFGGHTFTNQLLVAATPYSVPDSAGSAITGSRKTAWLLEEARFGDAPMGYEEVVSFH